MIGPWPDNGFIATKREARLICRACRKALGEGSECIETADAVYHRECGGAAPADGPTRAAEEYEGAKVVIAAAETQLARARAERDALRGGRGPGEPGGARGGSGRTPSCGRRWFPLTLQSRSRLTTGGRASAKSARNHGGLRLAAEGER
jgi:hypothetical protein